MLSDLAETTHITDFGGVERVIVKDATARDQAAVALTRQHFSITQKRFDAATIQVKRRRMV